MSRIFAASLLLSTLTLSAAAKASTPADGATTPTPVRVSTGTVAPTVLGSPVLVMPDRAFIGMLPDGAQVELSLTVSEKGMPRNIKVVKSFSPYVDNRVVESVSAMRFLPGRIDNQPTAAPMNLIVTVAQ